MSETDKATIYTTAPLRKRPSVGHRILRGIPSPSYETASPHLHKFDAIHGPSGWNRTKLQAKFWSGGGMGKKFGKRFDGQQDGRVGED